MDTINAVIDELAYLNYSYNRNHAPDITPERWVKVYGNNTFAMERRYQGEANNVN